MSFESFEISTDSYNPSDLRNYGTGGRNRDDDAAVSAPDTEIADNADGDVKANATVEKPAASQKKPRERIATVQQESGRSEKTTPAVPSVRKMFADGRLGIFFGVMFILIAVIMLLASISFLFYGPEDQSVVQNQPVENISANPQPVGNMGGWLGALLSHVLMYQWLGIGGFVVIYYVVAIALTLLGVHRFKFWRLTFKCLVSSIALSIISGFLTCRMSLPMYWGGEHGYYVNERLLSIGSWPLAAAVSILLATALILIYIRPIKGICRTLSQHWQIYKRRISAQYRQSMIAVSKSREREKEPVGQASANPAPAPHDDSVRPDAPDAMPVISREEYSPVEELQEANHQADADDELEVDIDVVYDSPEIEVATPSADDIVSPEIELEEVPVAPIEECEEVDIDAYDPTAELSRYRFPSIELLQERSSSYTIGEAEQQENNDTIRRTLQTYGIEIAGIKATVGPTITLYEIKPAPGVRIAKIKRLGDDMTMSLSALGIRIIAPIPGKGTIGMEVPNKRPQAVGIRTILSSKAYHESTAELPLALGSTIENHIYVTDLCKLPHLLVAGATGMGKSVGLNTIIASLLYKKHPAELKFVLVDPKMVEFSLYKCLERHFLAKLPSEENAIITDPTKVVATLNSLCLEMDNRYELLSKVGLRGIKEYNQRFIARRLNPEKGHRYLPYIVVIIDEFADLMITVGKEVEQPISRIAAKARAVGIHMILATQRPSVNVITGSIKANFPGRMAFRVTQMNDSRTIIDRPGAEQLIGRGDMLISRDGQIERVQCALIETDEVEAIVNDISNQIGYEHAYMLPEYGGADGQGSEGFGSLADRDPMFADAGREVIMSGMGSASTLQRKLRIGYPRAGKLIDQLEQAGVVGPQTAAGKPRTVLMDMYSFERMLEG